MPKYVIEREIAGVGASPAEALQAVSQTSCSVLSELGPSIQWVQSYVTDDKIEAHLCGTMMEQAAQCILKRRAVHDLSDQRFGDCSHIIHSY